jgi:hypothetical protein
MRYLWRKRIEQNKHVSMMQERGKGINMHACCKY